MAAVTRFTDEEINELRRMTQRQRHDKFVELVEKSYFRIIPAALSLIDGAKPIADLIYPDDPFPEFLRRSEEGLNEAYELANQNGRRITLSRYLLIPSEYIMPLVEYMETSEFGIDLLNIFRNEERDIRNATDKERERLRTIFDTI